MSFRRVLLLLVAAICRRLSLGTGIRVLRPPVLRQGVVLVSQPGEHNHFLYEQAVFLLEFSERGSRGVILERPTAFSIGEISPGTLPPPYMLRSYRRRHMSRMELPRLELSMKAVLPIKLLLLLESLLKLACRRRYILPMPCY